MFIFTLVNVSEEHRLIWVPFPSTGERALADFFSKKGFFLKKNFGEYEIETLSLANVSFSKFKEDKYDSYDIICSIDNPYRLIINHFKKFSTTNWTLKSNCKEILSEKFNEWIHPVIFDDILQIDPMDTTHFFLFPFFETENVKTYYLRVDRLEKDLNSLGVFGKKSFGIKKQHLPDLSNSYKDVFSYEHARIIYHLNKTTFDKLDYDPFSFTTRKLTMKEKVDFIHY